ncbi:hypothetical protein FNF31_07228 [Cafeteria roenbergensis]|uniref:TmcB/TmcC TPR repeats domain-containing protein n=1 Tax=Cafeteria roenbergensis TaxID=33653 RepID=A0A5A8C9V2_CAFRO|nr:hypothetical protein FNF31_07228 [Cafeteria roenbergensis]
MRMLLDTGAALEARDESGWGALLWAASNGHVDAIALLLDRGANAEAKDDDGWGALILAASKGHVGVIQVLLDRGADVEAVDNGGLTALIAAALSGRVGAMALLLDRGADLHAKTTDGLTALLWAAWNDNVDAMTMLLDRGADLEAKDKNGETALLRAARLGFVQATRLLLDRGADAEATTNDGRGAASVCTAERCKALLLDAERIQRWFGVLFLLSRESKASTAAFAITTISDLIQFSVFPMLIAGSLDTESTFRAVTTALSVAILDVDTLFALADVGSSVGRAVVFWAALTIVATFLGLLAYVIATILREGHQQAVVLRSLGNLASVLTTVAFMPASSLLLAVFHPCPSVNALGVSCQTTGHWVVISLVVIVLTVFAAVSTFFASVYIDTDLKSTALGAKVTGRVDAAMLVAKLVLVTCFTTMSLPTTLQVILCATAALTWLLGTLFVQPYVQPLANRLAASAATLYAWLVLAVATRLVAPQAGVDAVMVLGLGLAPMLGYFANVTYSTAVASSDFASLRSALQADIWSRHRVSLAQRVQSSSQHAGSMPRGASGGQDAAGTSGLRGYHSQPPDRHQQGARAQLQALSANSGAASGAGFASAARARAGRSGVGAGSGRAGPPGVGLALHHAASQMSLLKHDKTTASAGGGDQESPRDQVHIHVLADSGLQSRSQCSADQVSTADLLPGVSAEGLLAQAALAYEAMLKAWPKSAVTYASGSIFHRAYGSTVSSELTILAMARKQVGSAWDVSFLSYQRTRQLQERSASGLSAVDRILFDEAWTTAIDETTKAFAAQNKLYNHAVESNPDAHRIGKLAEELFKARSAAERKFRTMLQINPDSTTALRAYSRFCDDVLGDAERATELMNKANRIEEKHAKTNIKPLDAVIIGSPEEPLSVMDEMNAVITMTGELRRYGEITDANVATARLFGRGRSDLMGQSLASLFPEPLGSLYDAAILAYLSPHEKGEAFSRGAHVSVVQTAGGWLAPVRVSLQESAGSELDATPCLSMVVQRAPTKRRMFLVGEAVAGFPVLALDADSLAMLGDDSLGDSGDNEGAGELGSAGKDSRAEPANKSTAAAADTSAGEHGMFIGIPDASPDKSEAPDVGDAAGTARLLPGHESAMSALAKVQLDQATVSGGNGSVTSGLGSASRITKLILDTSLAKSDPMVWRVGAVVIGSLVAVITFAVALAVVLPISNADARLLVIANDLAQRRLYHSDSASNAWYQLVSVSFGFTAVNDWATLTTNLTESIDRMEAAHRELLSISQTVQGDLFDFELERMWDTCTESLVLYDCSKHEVMSATDLVEFTIYQLRQMAAEQPTTIITSPSFLTNVPNINLMALALREAEHTSATELANGMRQRLDMMTNVLVAAALLTFALATLGTTILMASIGRHRYRMLSSIPQISRDKLRELSRRSEQSQLAFVRAVGADTSDDENQLGDLVDDDQQQSMQMRQDLTAAKAARVRFTGESGEGTTEGGARHADGGRGSQGKPLPASESSPAHVRQKGSASTAAGCCTATRRRKSRYVVDSSWFVWKASLMITSPLTLIGGWIAVVLVMVSSMYTAISVDAARSSLLHSYAAGASALRGQLELVLLIAEQRRVGAMSEARTNSTKILQSLGGVLNGAETTSFGVRLPGLAATKDPTTTRLFNILVHDSCLALPHGSYYWEQCRALHDEYGLRGLHSFTTAMLDDGVQARSIFNEFNASDVRTMPDLIVSGELFKIVPPLRRYDAKSRESEIIIRHLVNITADAAVNRLDETWGLVQIVLGAFSGIFVLIVWLWALPSVRRLEHTRRAHFTVLMSLPDDVITGTPAITKVLSDLATGTGLTQAARALAGLAKVSLGQSRRHVRAQSHARRKAHQVAPVADPTTIEEGPDDSRIDSIAGHADLGASPKAS